MMSEEDYDFIVGFTIFGKSEYKTMHRHFSSLESAQRFANNVNIKDSHKIYVDFDLYQKEKERAERHKQLYLMEKDYQENKLSKYLIDKICERKFELQQEYKDFENDIKLNTLQEIHKELLEEIDNGENE